MRPWTPLGANKPNETTELGCDISNFRNQWVITLIKMNAVAKITSEEVQVF